MAAAGTAGAGADGEAAAAATKMGCRDPPAAARARACTKHPADEEGRDLPRFAGGNERLGGPQQQQHSRSHQRGWGGMHQGTHTSRGGRLASGSQRKVRDSCLY